MSALTLPAGTTRGLSPLGGRLLVATRLTCAVLLAVALGVHIASWNQPGTNTVIWGLRLVKAAVLVTVSMILLRRRKRDPVAAMLSLSFLLWTISSSVDFAGSGGPLWPALLDRFRFLLFALALLLFPDGDWLPRWTRIVAAAILLAFLIGLAEAIGLLPTKLFLPLAIGCVLLAVVALLVRYRSLSSSTARQQLKWVALGLVVGIGLILSARAGAAIAAEIAMPLASTIVLEGVFQTGIVVIALGFLTSMLRYRLYDAEAAISRSATYAALTAGLIALFAASETIIQSLSQRFLGDDAGIWAAGMAAALAAGTLAPLHQRVSDWTERRFRKALFALEHELPRQVGDLAETSHLAWLSAHVLARIETALRSTRAAMVVGGEVTAVRHIDSDEVDQWLADQRLPPSLAIACDHSVPDFPLRVPLMLEGAGTIGWILIGPRPDGSLYGNDEIDVLAAITNPVARSAYALRRRERQAA